MFDDDVYDAIRKHWDDKSKPPTVRHVAQVLRVPRHDILAAILRLRKDRRILRYALRPMNYARSIDFNAPHWNMSVLAPIKPTKNKGRKRQQDAS